MNMAILLYEPAQLASLDALLIRWGTKKEAPLIVSLDAEIDYALEERGITFISGKILQNRTTPAAYLRADELISSVSDRKELSVFQYRGVSVFEPLRFSIHIYLIDLLYYVDIIQRFLDTTPGIEHIVIPTSTLPIPKTSSTLAPFQSAIVYNAARLAAHSRSVRCESYESRSASVRAKNNWQVYIFVFKRALFGAALSVLNTAMDLRPRRPIRLLVSDYWRNIAPLMQQLPEAEMILIDRAQALAAGWKNIWRHKIRFMHIDHFLSREGRRRALAYARTCEEAWQATRGEAFGSSDLTFSGVDVRGDIGKIVTHLMTIEVPRIICDIEGTYAMYERLSPNAVLLRASISTQRHFSILPLVARECEIPSLELQHGIEYLGDGSATRRHAAQFLALYGPLVVDEHRALGDSGERLLAVGSPRFDSYIEKVAQARAKGAHNSVRILSNTPTMSIGERYGTYSPEEYFTALGKAVAEIPDGKLAVTSRSMGSRAVFVDEARERGLKGVTYEYVGATPLPRLFEQTDIFICSYSTVVYEALLYRIPVILAAFAPTDQMMSDFHFSRFTDSGALLIAHSPAELSDMLKKLASDANERFRMGEAGWDFMQKHYSFDGKASSRISDIIREWSCLREDS